MTYKICIHCGKELPLTDFYKHKNTRDGHLNSCKECVKTRVRENREEHAEQYRAYEKMRSKRPERIVLRKKITAERRKAVDGYQRAHNAVIRAVRDGRLEKPDKCQWCNSDKKVEAHHQDYKDTLNVIWLCSKCHKMLHLGKSDEAKRIQEVIRIPF